MDSETLLPTGLRLLGATIRVLWPGGEAALDPTGRDAVVIGRADSCDLVAAAPSLSRRHARLDLRARTIEDLGSSGGTWVAGERLPPHVPVPVLDGALVELARAVLLVPPHQPAAARPADVEGLVDLVAGSGINVLILGETGAGKEHVARAIHGRSERSRGPFVAINCAALPEHLLESELFGHERGAFTGADRARVGLFEAASGGTALLDEIGELPPALQAKLLRVVERREVTPVGSVRPRPVDTRFLAATHRDLATMIAAGDFRADLFYRIAGLTIRVPPLRERPEELAPLVRAFAGAVPVTPAALGALRAHGWPGNIRELRNVVERAVLLARGGPVDAVHVRFDAPPEPGAGAALRDELAALERRRILDALDATGGNQTQAARLLDMPLRTLLVRLDAYGLPRPRRR